MALLRYQVASKLAKDSNFYSFVDTGCLGTVPAAQQHDPKVNSKEAFVKREHVKRHPACRRILRRWWRALAGDAEEIDKSTYFELGNKVFTQVHIAPSGVRVVKW